MKNGPWAEEAANTDDPGMFGLPDKVTTLELRQWVDYEHNRLREERGELVNIKDGPRWWSLIPGQAPNSGTEPASSLELCDALLRWTDPQPLTRLMELEPAGETERGAPHHRDRARRQRASRARSPRSAGAQIGGNSSSTPTAASCSRRPHLSATSRSARSKRRQSNLTSRSTTHSSHPLLEFDRATRAGTNTHVRYTWPRPAGGRGGGEGRWQEPPVRPRPPPPLEVGSAARPTSAQSSSTRPRSAATICRRWSTRTCPSPCRCARCSDRA